MDRLIALKFFQIVKKYKIVFGIALLALITLMVIGFDTRRPVITAITPNIAMAGERFTISGSGFGKERDGSVITIGGRRVTASHYVDWTRRSITLELPDAIDSGSVYLETANGLSNGVFFTRRKPQEVPIAAPEEAAQILPTTAAVGMEIKIAGSRFGFERGMREVLFMWRAVDGAVRHLAAADDHYVSWTQNEIRMRVPDGAHSGLVRITQQGGEDIEIYLNIDGSERAKQYDNPQEYALFTAMTVDAGNAGDAGDADDAGDAGTIEESAQAAPLYVWLPRIAETPAQGYVQLLRRNFVPLFVHPQYQLTLVEIDGPPSAVPYRLEQAQIFRRWRVQTDLTAARFDISMPSEFIRRYTAANQYIPSDDPQLRAAARQFSQFGNDVRRAEAIYRYVRERLTPENGGTDIDARTAYDEGRGNAYSYAALFAALARAAEIPARLAAGYVVTDADTIVRHFWNQFFVPGIGWVPVDAAYGDGIAPPLPDVEGDAALFYFGNIDAHHIAFSYETAELPIIHPNGSVRTIASPYSVQSHHEETAGNIDSYSTTWHTVQLIGNF